MINLRHSLLLLAVILLSCSSSKTFIGRNADEAIQNTSQYFILVRTGNPALDKAVYEFAFREFQDLIPLAESSPKNTNEGGIMEVTFLSTAESAFVSSSSSYGTANAYSSGWYNGYGYWNGTSFVQGQSTTVGTSSSFTWQNSTMLITLKGANRKRIWSADYNYKGGWEMSGWTVNTADEAARLVIQRLAEKFREDFETN